MKFLSLKKAILPAIGSIILLISGCVKDDFDQPPVNIPHFTDTTITTTIAGLEAMLAGNALKEITNDTIIIQGIVTANDKSGNIYKSIYIQDNTAGIQIGIDQVDMYIDYKVGQRLFIKCKGLYIGDYNGVIQLGYNNAGSIGRIPEAMIAGHIFPDSLPGPVPAPKTVDLSGNPPVAPTTKISQLIEITNVTFPAAGSPLVQTPDDATNRSIANASGAVIQFGSDDFVIRTSKYADFAYQLLPFGKLRIRGILSVYNGQYQLYIRDMNDITVIDSSIAVIVNGNFATTGSLDPFTQYSVTGTDVWVQSTHSGDSFAKMSGYTSGTANEDWLISPSMNFNNFTEEVFKFFTMMNYGAAGDGSLKVYYSTDYTSGDPNSATWTEFTGVALSGGAWAKVESGDIDVSMINGTNVHIAFKYTCTTTNIATWEVGGILINGKRN